MLDRETTAARIHALGAVAVLRAPSAAPLVRVAEALAEGGVAALEVTMTVPGALSAIRAIREALGDAVLLGVGSVLDAATATAAVDAGARFVVSPVFRREVVGAAHAAGAAVFPGAFTPSECLAAHEAGADAVKVFPADVLGTAFIRAVLAPMPHLRLMPTGGVTPENAGEWLRAGAFAVGLGGALVPPAAVEAGDYAAITERARRLCASIADARG